MPRSYTITPYDVSVEELAQRFHIGDPKAILKINPTLFPTGADSGQFTAGMHGLAIFLPDATKSNLDWTPYTASAGETLAHVCKKMNKDRRIDPSRKGRDIPTPPWLTPQYLLDAYENADLRAGHGADASKVKLAPGEMVNVSFPQRLAGARHIAATPKGTTTFHVPPDWVIELTNAYESIRARTRAFEPSVNALRETRRSAAVEVSALNACDSNLQLTIDHPAHAPQLHTSEITSLRKMSRALATLHDTAAASMVDNVFLYVDNRAQLDATLDVRSRENPRRPARREIWGAQQAARGRCGEVPAHGDQPVRRSVVRLSDVGRLSAE